MAKWGLSQNDYGILKAEYGHDIRPYKYNFLFFRSCVSWPLTLEKLHATREQRLEDDSDEDERDDDVLDDDVLSFSGPPPPRMKALQNISKKTRE